MELEKVSGGQNGGSPGEDYDIDHPGYIYVIGDGEGSIIGLPRAEHVMWLLKRIRQHPTPGEISELYRILEYYNIDTARISHIVDSDINNGIYKDSIDGDRAYYFHLEGEGPQSAILTEYPADTETLIL